MEQCTFMRLRELWSHTSTFFRSLRQWAKESSYNHDKPQVNLVMWLVRRVTWFTEEVEPVPAACFAEGEAGGGAQAPAGHLRREGEKNYDKNVEEKPAQERGGIHPARK